MPRYDDGQAVLTLFGAAAAATMVIAYAFESRGDKWIAIFAIACAATAIYGIASEAWIFAVLEAVWSAVAFMRFANNRKIGNSAPLILDRSDT